MTRQEALATVARLGQGLAPDLSGVSRLLERIAGSDEHEMLMDVLAELGAQALLDSGGGHDATR